MLIKCDFWITKSDLSEEDRQWLKENVQWIKVDPWTDKKKALESVKKYAEELEGCWEIIPAPNPWDFLVINVTCRGRFGYYDPILMQAWWDMARNYAEMVRGINKAMEDAIQEEIDGWQRKADLLRQNEITLQKEEEE